MFRDTRKQAALEQLDTPLTAAERLELRRKWQQIGLAVGMLIAGTCNTLTCKAAFSTESDGHLFNHPFVQAGAMFCGEVACMLYFLASSLVHRKRIKWPPARVVFGFALTSSCDIVGTSTMYAGLTMTNASTYQMLRGAVVIFTGFMSQYLLRRRTRSWQWCGMAFVFAGAMVVGSTSVLYPDPGAAGASAGTNPLVGDALVVGSQLFAALQMVLQETFVSGHDVPALLAVGCEGVWGLTGLGCLLLVLQQTGGADGPPIEDSLDAFRQIRDEPKLLALLAANAFSIAFFNGFGMAITKTSSAAYRVVLDSLRTGVVWLFGIATGVERFHLLQVAGFAVMFLGTTTYNETLRLPCLRYPDAAERAAEEERRRAAESRAQPLLPLERKGTAAPSPIMTFQADKFFQLSPTLTRMTIQPK